MKNISIYPWLFRKNEVYSYNRKKEDKIFESFKHDKHEIDEDEKVEHEERKEDVKPIKDECIKL